MYDVSIIIPNLNGEEFLLACLESLKIAIDQAKINAEIILVDNASSDSSRKFLLAFAKKMKLNINF